MKYTCNPLWLCNDANSYDLYGVDYTQFLSLNFNGR